MDDWDEMTFAVDMTPAEVMDVIMSLHSADEESDCDHQWAAYQTEMQGVSTDGTRIARYVDSWACDKCGMRVYERPLREH